MNIFVDIWRDFREAIELEKLRLKNNAASDIV
jgi:hypothetical protein